MLIFQVLSYIELVKLKNIIMNNVSNNRLNTPPSPKKPAGSPSPSPRPSPRRDVERQNGARSLSNVQRNLFDADRSEITPVLPAWSRPFSVQNSSEKKRPREGDVDTNELTAKRPRLMAAQAAVVVAEETNPELWLPNDVWAFIMSSLSVWGRTSFGSVSKDFNTIYRKAIITDPSWVHDLIFSYKRLSLMGEVPGSQSAFRLLESTVAQGKETASIVKNDTKAILNGLFGNYINSKKLNLFMVSIVFGEGFSKPSLTLKTAVLNVVRMVCERNIVVIENEYVYFHARKILRHFFHNEGETLCGKSIQALFSAVEYAMRNDDPEFSYWIQLLDNALDTLSIKQREIWYKKCIKLLKMQWLVEDDITEMNQSKKEILNLLISKFPEYLHMKNTYVLSELIIVLRSMYVPNSLKIVIENELRNLCRNDMQWVRYLVKEIAKDHLRASICIKSQASSYRLINFLIKEYGEKVVCELIDITNYLIIEFHGFYRKSLMIAIDEVCKNCNVSEKSIIVKAIQIFMLNNALILDHELSRKLTLISTSR